MTMIYPSIEQETATIDSARNLKALFSMIMTNFDYDGFEQFPVSDMSLSRFLLHFKTALGMMTWSPWKWSRKEYICIDFPSAWWLAGHAIQYTEYELLREETPHDLPA